MFQLAANFLSVLKSKADKNIEISFNEIEKTNNRNSETSLVSEVRLCCNDFLENFP